MVKRCKVRRGRVVFERLIARRKQEGLTWRETALAGGVPLATLMDWDRRLRSGPAPRPSKRAFVEIAPRAAAPIDRVEIVLRSGRRLVLACALPPAELSAWIEALERPC